MGEVGDVLQSRPLFETTASASNRAAELHRIAQGGELTPIRAEKKRSWERAVAEYERITDALGHPIDPGILETVVALNLLDIHTVQSCEGHPDWGTGSPYIDIEAQGVEEMQERTGAAFANARTALDASKPSTDHHNPSPDVIKLFDEAHALRKEVLQQNLREQQKILEHLSEFYVGRTVSFDRRLIIAQSNGYGAGRIESQGASLQQIASQEVRQQKLAEYQEEMKSFTTFLKGRYLRS